jgi:hypothetical protein
MWHFPQNTIFSRRAAASAQNSAAPPAMPLNLRSILSSARLFPGDLVDHRSQAIDIRDDQGTALLLDDAEP